MIDDLSGIGKQIAYAVVFALVVCASVLAIKSQAAANNGQRVANTQALISLIAKNRALVDRNASAQTVIDGLAESLSAAGKEEVSTQLLKAARNHALLLEKSPGGYTITGWIGRSQNGQYFRYQKKGSQVIQTCNQGLDCQTVAGNSYGLWEFSQADCPSPAAACQAQPGQPVTGQR